ncbi:23S rRNA (guanosine(2251)-2'-O)-methyltransferase RlmB [Altibacter sp. HG106]|uniref:23S rRNA (guanosine(2251)-2'-O)-methyltransferase RlmB n=1 Tax=Altibacter sp. HG106 TaxID=3023937 RepID=UPI00234FCB3F|nr:23S rRNA (guanosine(2251)-2'-O)-methyltransferase RlmB [Altibacter sp. HG106]MDC7995982.1 23S rRNA (guanosine(2251)-2'-O)-methyltransferase RlmB [Altibacter sp. HG106]
MKKEAYVFGIYPVLEAVAANKSIDKLYVQKGLENSKIEEIIPQLEAQGTSINLVPVEKLDRLVRSNHQGVVAITSPIQFVTMEELVEPIIDSGKKGLFIVLDQISDVRNFGAMIRTAECTGVHGIIIQKKGGAPVSGDTVKTSAGAIFNIPICKVDHIKDALFYLQGSGIKTIAATEKTNHVIYDLNLTDSLALVMGSEGTGISKSVLKMCDEQASLPVYGEINSLNVSVACGAFLYEIVRQRS